MSVLIKGMKMPNACCHCPCSDSAGCAVTGRIMTTEEMAGMVENIGDCPARPLPEKHGKLIDADALIAKYGDWYTEEGTETGFTGTLEMLLKDAPAVVEAEGKE